MIDKFLLSISKDYHEQVNEILDSLPKNKKSNFICQAIVEKYERDSEIQKDKPLKEQVLEIIEELIGTDIVLIKGNVGNVSSLSGITLPQQPNTIQQEENNGAFDKDTEDALNEALEDYY